MSARPDLPPPESPIVGAIFFALALLGMAMTFTVDPRPTPPAVVEVRTAADLVVAHTVTTSVADDLPGLDQLDSVRFAELPLTPGRGCR